MYESRDDFTSNLRQTDEQFAKYGPQTAYSTAYRINPSIVDSIRGESSPYFSTTEEFVSSLRSSNPSYKSLTDDQIADDIRAKDPLLGKVWFGGPTTVVPEDKDDAPEPENEFLKAFPGWLGPIPSADLSKYKNGERLAAIMQKNLDGDTEGFWSQLKGERGLREWAPWVTDTLDALDLAKVVNTTKKAMAGDFESISEDDWVDFNLYTELIKRESEGGWKSKAGSSLRQSMVMMGEFGLWAAAQAGAFFNVFAGPVDDIAVGAAAAKGVAEDLLKSGAKKWLVGTLSEKAREKLAANIAKAGIVRGGKVAKRALVTKYSLDALRDTVQEGVTSSLLKGSAGAGKKVLAKAAGYVAGLSVPAGQVASLTLATQIPEMIATGVSGGEIGTKRSFQRQLDSLMSGNGSESRLAAGLLDEAIENFTEVMGGDVVEATKLVFGGTVGKLAAKIPLDRAKGVTAANAMRVLAEKFDDAAKARIAAGTATKEGVEAAKGIVARGIATTWRAAREGTGVFKASEYLQGAGIGGFAEEWGEERLGGFLRGLFGLEGDLDQNAVARAISSTMPQSNEDAAAEAVALAVPIFGARGLAFMGKRAIDHKDQYTSWNNVLRGALEAQYDKNRPLNMVPDDKRAATDVRDYHKTLKDMHSAVLRQSYNMTTSQGPFMDMVNRITDKFFGIQWVSSQLSVFGDSGFQRSGLEFFAAQNANSLFQDSMAAMNLELNSGKRSAVWSKVKNARPDAEDAEGKLAYKAKSQILNEVADEISSRFVQRVDEMSKVVKIRSGMTVADWEKWVAGRGIKVGDLTSKQAAEELSAIDARITKDLANPEGSDSSLFYRDEATGYIYLKPEVANGMTTLERAAWAKHSVRTVADADKLVGKVAEAGPALKNYVMGAARRLMEDKKSFDALPKDQQDKVFEVANLETHFISSIGVGAADIEKIDKDPRPDDSLGVKTARAALSPDSLSPSELQELAIAYNFPSYDNFRKLRTELAHRGELMRSYMSGTRAAKGNIVEHTSKTGVRTLYRVAGPGSKPRQYSLVPVDKAATGGVVDVPGGVVVETALGGAYKNLTKVGYIEFGRPVEMVGSDASFRELGITPPSEKYKERTEPFRKVAGKAGPKMDADIEKSSYRHMLLGQSASIDGEQVIRLTRPGVASFEEIYESAVKMARFGRSDIVKYQGYPVFKPHLDAAVQVQKSLIDKQRSAALTPQEEKVLGVLGTKVGEPIGQNVFELMAKVDMFVNRGHSEAVDEFGYTDTYTMREEAEAFAKIANEMAAEGETKYTQSLAGFFSTLFTAEELSLMAYGRKSAVPEPSMKPAKKPADKPAPAPKKPTKEEEAELNKAKERKAKSELLRRGKEWADTLGELLSSYDGRVTVPSLEGTWKIAGVSPTGAGVWLSTDGKVGPDVKVVPMAELLSANPALLSGVEEAARNAESDADELTYRTLADIMRDLASTSVKPEEKTPAIVAEALARIDRKASSATSEIDRSSGKVRNPLKHYGAGDNNSARAVAALKAFSEFMLERGMLSAEQAGNMFGIFSNASLGDAETSAGRAGLLRMASVLSDPRSVFDYSSPDAVPVEDAYDGLVEVLSGAAALEDELDDDGNIVDENPDNSDNPAGESLDKQAARERNYFNRLVDAMFEQRIGGGARHGFARIRDNGGAPFATVMNAFSSPETSRASLSRAMSRELGRQASAEEVEAKVAEVAKAAAEKLNAERVEGEKEIDPSDPVFVNHAVADYAARFSPVWNEESWAKFKSMDRSGLGPVELAFLDLVKHMELREAIAMWGSWFDKWEVAANDMAISGTIDYADGTPRLELPSDPRQAANNEVTDATTVGGRFDVDAKNAMSAHLNSVSSDPAKLDELVSFLKKSIGGVRSVAFSIPFADFLNKPGMNPLVRLARGVDVSALDSLKALADLVDKALAGSRREGTAPWHKYTAELRSRFFELPSEMRAYAAASEAGRTEEVKKLKDLFSRTPRIEEDYLRLRGASASAYYFLRDALIAAELAKAVLSGDRDAAAKGYRVAGLSESEAAKKLESAGAREAAKILSGVVSGSRGDRDGKVGSGIYYGDYWTPRNRHSGAQHLTKALADMSAGVRLTTVPAGKKGKRIPVWREATPLEIALNDPKHAWMLASGPKTAIISEVQFKDLTHLSFYNDPAYAHKKTKLNQRIPAADLPTDVRVELGDLYTKLARTVRKSEVYLARVPTGDKSSDIFVRMNRAAVIQEFRKMNKARASSGERPLDPDVPSDIDLVMQTMLRPVFTMSEHIGEARGNALLDTPRGAKRTRALTTDGVRPVVTESGLHAFFRVAIIKDVVFAAPDGTRVRGTEVWNGQQYGSRDYMRRMSVSLGRLGPGELGDGIGAVKTQTYGEGVLKSNTVSLAPFEKSAEILAKNGVADINPVETMLSRLASSLKADTVIDTGGAKEYDRTGRYAPVRRTEEVEIDVGGVKQKFSVEFEVLIVRQSSGHTYVTSNLEHPAKLSKKKNTVSTAFNLPMETAEQRAIAASYMEQRLAISKVQKSLADVVADDRLANVVKSTISDGDDPGRLLEKGVPPSSPFVGSSVEMKLASAVRAAMGDSMSLQTASSLVATGEETGEARKGIKDKFLRPMEVVSVNGSDVLVPGLVRDNVEGARYALKLKNGANLQKFKDAVARVCHNPNSKSARSDISKLATDWAGQELTGAEKFFDLLLDDGSFDDTSVYEIDGGLYIGGELRVFYRVPGAIDGKANGLFRLSVPVTVEERATKYGTRIMPGVDNFAKEDGASMFRRGEDVDGDSGKAKHLYQSLPNRPLSPAEAESLAEKILSIDARPVLSPDNIRDSQTALMLSDALHTAAASAPTEAEATRMEEAAALADEMLNEFSASEDPSATGDEADEAWARAVDLSSSRELMRAAKAARPEVLLSSLIDRMQASLARTHVASLRSMTKTQAESRVDKEIWDNVQFMYELDDGSEVAVTVGDAQKYGSVETALTKTGRLSRPLTETEVRRGNWKVTAGATVTKGVVVTAADAIAYVMVYAPSLRVQSETDAERFERYNVLRGVYSNATNIVLDNISENRAAALGLSIDSLPLLAGFATKFPINPAAEAASPGGIKVPGTVANMGQEWVNWITSRVPSVYVKILHDYAAQGRYAPTEEKRLRDLVKKAYNKWNKSEPEALRARVAELRAAKLKPGADIASLDAEIERTISRGKKLVAKIKADSENFGSNLDELIDVIMRSRAVRSVSQVTKLPEKAADSFVSAVRLGNLLENGGVVGPLADRAKVSNDVMLDDLSKVSPLSARVVRDVMANPGRKDPFVLWDRLATSQSLARLGWREAAADRASKLLGLHSIMEGGRDLLAPVTSRLGDLVSSSPMSQAQKARWVTAALAEIGNQVLSQVQLVPALAGNELASGIIVDSRTWSGLGARDSVSVDGTTAMFTSRPRYVSREFDAAMSEMFRAVRDSGHLFSVQIKSPDGEVVSVEVPASAALPAISFYSVHQFGPSGRFRGAVHTLMPAEELAKYGAFSTPSEFESAMVDFFSADTVARRTEEMAPDEVAEESDVLMEPSPVAALELAGVSRESLGLGPREARTASQAQPILSLPHEEADTEAGVGKIKTWASTHPGGVVLVSPPVGPVSDRPAYFGIPGVVVRIGVPERAAVESMPGYEPEAVEAEAAAAPASEYGDKTAKWLRNEYMRIEGEVSRLNAQLRNEDELARLANQTGATVERRKALVESKRDELSARMARLSAAAYSPEFVAKAAAEGVNMKRFVPEPVVGAPTEAPVEAAPVIETAPAVEAPAAPVPPATPVAAPAAPVVPPAAPVETAPALKEPEVYQTPLSDVVEKLRYVEDFMAEHNIYPTGDELAATELEAAREIYRRITAVPEDSETARLRALAIKEISAYGKKLRSALGTSATLEVGPMQDGKVSLRFSGMVTPKAQKYYGDGRWALEKALAESGYTKAAIEQIKKFEPAKRGSLEEIVRAAEAATMRPVTIAVKSSDEWRETSYEGLTVNKGQGTYMEVDILSDFPVPGQHGGFDKLNQMGWFRARAMPDGSLDVQEVQSELYQKNKGGIAQRGLAGDVPDGDEYDYWRGVNLDALDPRTEADGYGPTYRETLAWEYERQNRGRMQEDTETTLLVPVRMQKEFNLSLDQATFLNLMLKDQTWVPVFVDAIAKWAKAQGYEKVRFPTGETAARVEGHQVLADRLVGLQNAYKETERTLAGVRLQASFRTREHMEAVEAVGNLIEEIKKLPQGDPDAWDLVARNSPSAELEELEAAEYEAAMEVERAKRMVARLEGDLVRLRVDQEELKTQGIEKLAPIESFYEKRVGKIVRAMGSQLVADANGNTWNELNLDAVAYATSATATPSDLVRIVNSVPNVKLTNNPPTTPQSLARIADNFEAEIHYAGKDGRPVVVVRPLRYILDDQRIANAVDLEHPGLAERLKFAKTSDGLGAALLAYNESVKSDGTYDPGVVAGASEETPMFIGDLGAMKLEFKSLGLDETLFDHPIASRILSAFVGYDSQPRTAEAVAKAVRDRNYRAAGAERISDPELAERVGSAVERAFEEMDRIDSEKLFGESTVQPAEGTGATTGVDFGLVGPGAVGSSTEDFDATVRAVAARLLEFGGTEKAHRMLLETSRYISAEEKTLHNVMKRLRETFFSDPAISEVFLMDDSTDEGKKDFRSGALASMRAALGGAKNKHKYTEKQRNELIRALMAIDAIVEGNDKIVYGGRWAHRLDKDSGKIVFAPREATFVDENGVPSYRTKIRVDGELVEVVRPAHLDSVDNALKAFENSEVRGVLLSLGRTKEMLDIRSVASQIKNEYKEFRDRLNAHSRFMLPVPNEYLAKVENYVPHFFGGRGFETAELRDAKQRVASQMTARGHRSGKTSRLEHIVFDIKGTTDKTKPTEGQVKLYIDTMSRLDRIRDASSLAEYESKARSMSLRELNGQLFRALMDAEEDRSLEVGAGYEMDLETADTLAGLRHVLANYVDREWTERTAKREYANYLDAYMESKGRSTRRQIDPFTTIQRYVHEVMNSMRKQLVTRMFMLTADEAGLPILLVRPNTENQEEGLRQIADESTIRAQVKMLSEHAGIKDVPADTPAKQLVWLLDSGKVDLSGYATNESNFKSVEKFYAKKGKADRAFQHIIGKPPQWMWTIGGVQYDMFRFLSDLAQFTKHMAVSWSMFFGTSGLESVVAGTGPKVVGKDRNILFRLPSATKEYRKYRRMIKRGDAQLDDLLYKLHRAGIDLSESNISDGSTSVVDRLIDRSSARIGEMFGRATGEQSRKWMRVASGRHLSSWLMGDFFPGLKMWAAVDFIEKLKDTGLTEEQAMRRAAPIINAAYGGLMWDEYAWATPKTLAYLNLFMFAPQWTKAAWNIAGGGNISGKMLENRPTQEMNDFVFLRNWPAMYLFCLQLVPNLLQASIFLAAKALGKAEPDDEPLAVMNETGKGGGKPSVDITPFVRQLPWYEGGDSGDRRVYIQFGKQSYEVLDGWLGSPPVISAWHTLLRKTSMPVKLVWEQAMGHSPGSPDFALPFYGKGLVGLWSSPKGFMGSRLGTALAKFTPMTLSSIVSNPDGAAIAMFAPASKGMSRTKATDEMAKLLASYAEGGSFKILKTKVPLQSKLELVVSDYMDAMERNGYDPVQVMKAAKGTVMPWLYSEFFKAFEAKDEVGLEKAAKKIIRLQGTAQSLASSYSNRKTRERGTPPTIEERKAIEAAFEGMLPPVYRLRGMDR